MGENTNNEIPAIHERINKLNNRLTVVETTQPGLQNILERNTEVTEKLTDTLHEMQTSIVLMNQKMDEQARNFESFKGDMEEANARNSKNFEKVDARFKTIEEKGNFDIQGFFKKNFPWIVILILSGISTFSKYFKM